MKALRTDHLVIANQGHRVAGPLDVSFSTGRLSCLTGANGVGKSTFLRTISGYQQPLSGEVWLDRTPLRSLTVSQRALTLAVVLTGRPDAGLLKVSEMVALGRSPYTDFWGNLRTEDKAIVSDVMDRMGIASLANRSIRTLSDGEMQKTMIAKALAQQTPVILLDEPTSFLDFPSKVEMMRLLASIAHEEGKIVILSTHDVQLAVRFADDIYRFADGLEWVSKDEVSKDINHLLRQQ